MKPSIIHKYAEQIRCWMNQPRVSRRLRRQLGRWNQLNSCLDTLQHTELAIQAYAAHKGELNAGERYLAIYGLLQAFVLQQDAICHLDEAMGGPGDAAGKNKNLQYIRNVRNWSVGHPTKSDRKDTMSHHRIARAKLGNGFELYTSFDDGRRQFTFISLADLIRRQRIEVARLMRKITDAKNDRNVSRTPVELKRRLSPAVQKHRAAKLAKRHSSQHHPVANQKHPPHMKRNHERRSRVIPVVVDRRRAA